MMMTKWASAALCAAMAMASSGALAESAWAKQARSSCEAQFLIDMPEAVVDVNEWVDVKEDYAFEKTSAYGVEFGRGLTAGVWEGSLYEVVVESRSMSKADFEREGRMLLEVNAEIKKVSVGFKYARKAALKDMMSGGGMSAAKIAQDADFMAEGAARLARVGQVGLEFHACMAKAGGRR